MHMAFLPCLLFFVFLFHSNEHNCVPTQLAICHKPERSTRWVYLFFFFAPHATQKQRCWTGLCASVNLPRVCPKREGDVDDSQQLFSASAPPASLSLLGNFEVRGFFVGEMNLQPRQFWIGIGLATMKSCFSQQINTFFFYRYKKDNWFIHFRKIDFVSTIKTKPVKHLRNVLFL